MVVNHEEQNTQNSQYGFLRACTIAHIVCRECGDWCSGKHCCLTTTDEITDEQINGCTFLFVTPPPPSHMTIFMVRFYIQLANIMAKTNV